MTRRRRLARALFGAVAAAQVAYGQVPGTRTPRQTQAVLGLLLAASAADAVASRGWRRGALPVAAAGAVGFGAEVVGVRTGLPFGRYHYGDKLGPKVGGVALAVPAAWALLARPSWVAGGLAAGPGASRARRVAMASCALTAWDVFLDPRMAADGYWTWERPGVYEGIPASNYAGWLVTSAVVFAVFAALDGEDDPAVDGGDALALYAWTWIGETFANAALWKRPRVAAAGAAAMGAVAVPALRAWVAERRA